MPYPVPGIMLEEKKAMFKLFIEHGISGADSTIIKTKISRVKGGGLAAHFSPTPILSFIISDDNGESGHHMTASGPMVTHKSTYADALSVIERYGIADHTPPSILKFLEKNRNKKTRERKTDHVYQTVIARNEDALIHIKEKAEQAGLSASVTPHLRGEAKEKAKELCREVFSQTIKKPTLFIYGGETTVSFGKSRPGKGGRNQEFATACLEYLRGNAPKGKWAISALATDGVDFIKESAGAIVDEAALDAAFRNSFSIQKYLERHDTYPLLKQLSANVVAGPTGTNVGDIILFLREPVV
jgi:glycerate 2-kinase